MERRGNSFGLRSLKGSPWILAVGMLAGALGCTKSPMGDPHGSIADNSASLPQQNKAAAPTASKNLEGHGHKDGAHGGMMISLGRDSYHVEAVLDETGTVRLYTLGKDETRVIDVEAQALQGFAKLVGSATSLPIVFEPAPQAGDAAGRTSQFVGKLPSEWHRQDVEVTIPNIVIDGERFRLGFQSASSGHSDVMPNKVTDEEENQLYLVPQGKYTDEDIEANGRTTAAAKFKGLKSSHNMSPNSGDKICPVTRTKANPNFTWIVGGKAYEFCCPPCVDEFVKAAKLTPEKIGDPTEYVQP